MAFTKITAAGIGSTETVTLDGVSVINNESIGGNLTVTGNATISGVLTYEDVTNVDSIGIITARAGVLVGSGITLSKDGDGFFTGVTTTGSLVSSGAISGTTGTYSDDVTVTGSNKKFITNSSSSGDYIRLYAAGGTGKWDIYGNGANLRFSDNESAGVVQFDTDVTFADKIVHTGDTNTAIRFPAADTITAETGGSERLRITSAGYVGIGENSPDNILHVNSGATNTAAKFESTDTEVSIQLTDTTGSAIIKARNDFRFDNSTGELARITSAGDMGLGTNSPNSLLHITKSASTAYDASQTDAQRGSTATLNITNDDTTNNSFAQIAFRNDGTNQSIARIVAIKRSTNSSHLAFVTEHGATPAERMRITSDGFIGVGGGTPA